MVASVSKRLTTYSDGSFKLEKFELNSSVQWYMQREDKDTDVWHYSVRDCASCPAVFVMKDDPHVKMTQQQQYYLRAINYNMALEDVFLLLDDHLAFSNNGAGFYTLENPKKADYFFNRTLTLPPPSLDKVRTTSRSVLTGEEVTVSGVPYLKVKVFDSRLLPALKPGYSYPTDISEVDPNAYLYMPETHPEMFLVANIVNKSGEVVQFPRGALYPRFENGRTTVSFVPHIANLAFGDILYPLRYLLKLPLGSPKPSPYRHDA